MAREIVIRIQIPEGVITPDVDYQDGKGSAPPDGGHLYPPAPAYGAPAAPQTVPSAPPAPAPAVAQAAQIFPGAIVSQTPECNEHGPMRYYPAGRNDKTGKDFSASYRCPVPRCETRPVWGV